MGGGGKKLGNNLRWVGGSTAVRSEWIILTDLGLDAKVLLQLKTNTSPLFSFIPYQIYKGNAHPHHLSNEWPET